MHERDVISDEAWAVIEPLLPQVQGRSRPWLDHRMVVEGIVWRFRTGSPWRDLPERFGPWNTVFKRFDRWAKDGTWQRILSSVQSRSDQLGKLDWVVSIDSTITRVHQHGATLARSAGALSNCKNLGPEPPDHAIGRSRGGLTSKIHLVADGRGRPLSMMLTPGNINDTTMLSDTIDLIRVPAAGRGRPSTRPDRVLADKGYPARANRAFLASRGIKSTIPDRDDQKMHRANRGSASGRPTNFDAEIYKSRNVVERSFNRLKNWRGIAMRSDKTARNYQARVTVAAILIWINTDIFNTA